MTVIAEHSQRKQDRPALPPELGTLLLRRVFTPIAEQALREPGQAAALMAEAVALLPDGEVARASDGEDGLTSRATGALAWALERSNGQALVHRLVEAAFESGLPLPTNHWRRAVLEGLGSRRVRDYLHQQVLSPRQLGAAALGLLAAARGVSPRGHSFGRGGLNDWLKRVLRAAHLRPDCLVVLGCVFASRRDLSVSVLSAQALDQGRRLLLDPSDVLEAPGLTALEKWSVYLFAKDLCRVPRPLEEQARVFARLEFTDAEAALLLQRCPPELSMAVAGHVQSLAALELSRLVAAAQSRPDDEDGMPSPDAQSPPHGGWLGQDETPAPGPIQPVSPPAGAAQPQSTNPSAPPSDGSGMSVARRAKGEYYTRMLSAYEGHANRYFEAAPQDPIRQGGAARQLQWVEQQAGGLAALERLINDPDGEHLIGMIDDFLANLRARLAAAEPGWVAFSSAGLPHPNRLPTSGYDGKGSPMEGQAHVGRHDAATEARNQLPPFPATAAPSDPWGSVELSEASFHTASEDDGKASRTDEQPAVRLHDVPRVVTSNPVPPSSSASTVPTGASASSRHPEVPGLGAPDRKAGPGAGLR